jgi:hypothetical protein
MPPRNETLKQKFLDLDRVKNLAQTINESSTSKDAMLDKAHLALLEMMTKGNCKVVLGPELAESILNEPPNSLPGPTEFGTELVSAFPEIGLLWGEFVRRAAQASGRAEMVMAKKLRTSDTLISFFGLKPPDNGKHIYNYHWTLDLCSEDGDNYTEREQTLFRDRSFFLDLICVGDTVQSITMCLFDNR